MENEGNDPRDEDRDDRQRDGRQPSQDADVIGPHGHGGHLPVHHVQPEEMPNVLRDWGTRALLEYRLQLRPESSGFLLLLVEHPLMESPQRQEEQHETEEDEPVEKSADPEDVGGRGRRRRPRDREQEKSDEDKVPEREGERQGAERLEAEGSVFVIRAQRERSASETLDAPQGGPGRPEHPRRR